MAKQLNVNLAFTADTGKAKAQLQDLQNQLNKVINMPAASLPTQEMEKNLKSATHAAAELKVHLENAMNPKTGTLDFTKLNQSIKSSGKNLTEYAAKLNQIGPEGQKAFMMLAQSVASAEVPIRRSNQLLTELWTTMKNTARWQLTSSMLHGFMGAVQSAVGYAEDLNESLNNIRIVTGQSVEQMRDFAKEANKAAKSLSTSTTNYTNAALIYYQQGLTEKAVKERTDITVQMANVSRQATEEVSDQMTAIWNNYAKGGEDLTHFANAMVKLGADTASSSSEIAQGLEKFAAIGDTIGLSFDNAAAALATVTATTRQSADVVGTAFKTMFARIQGLNLGETLDDGTTLNKYSEALDKVGIFIFDQNGQLKDMNSILEEMGAKWETLSKDQQVGLAQTVAGVRQYTQLVALMDNFDFYQQNLASAQNSEGALKEQAKIYEESWEAANKRLRASMEDLWADLIDDEVFIDVINALEKVVSVVDTIVESMGGFKGILLATGAIFTRVFQKQITQSLTDATYSMKTWTKAGRESLAQEQKSVVNNMLNQMRKNNKGKEDSAEIQILEAQLTDQQKLLDLSKQLTEDEIKKYQILLDQKRVRGQMAMVTEAEAKKAQQQAAEAKKRAEIVTGSHGGSNQFNEITKLLNNNVFQGAIGKLKSGSVADLSKNDANAYWSTYKQIFSQIEQAPKKAQASLKEYVNSWIDSLKITAEAKEQLREAKQSIIDSGNASAEAANDVDKHSKALDKMGDEAKEAADNQDRLNREMNEKTTRDYASSFVSLSSGVMGVASAFTSIDTALKTIADDDIPIVEKLTTGITSFASAATMAVPAVQSLMTATGLGLGTIGLIAGGILAILGFLSACEKAAQANQEAYDKAVKSADILAQSAKEVENNFNTLKNSADEYEDLINALHRCGDNTDTWRDSLAKVNDKIHDIIDTYPELLKIEGMFNDDGTLNVEKYREFLESQKNNVISSQNAATWAKVDVSKKSNQLERDRIDNKIFEATGGYFHSGGGSDGRDTFDFFADIVKNNNRQQWISKILENNQEVIDADWAQQGGSFEQLLDEIAEYVKLQDGVANALNVIAATTLGGNASEDVSNAFKSGYESAQNEYSSMSDNELKQSLKEDAGLKFSINEIKDDDNDNRVAILSNGQEILIDTLKSQAAENKGFDQALESGLNEYIGDFDTGYNLSKESKATLASYLASIAPAYRDAVAENMKDLLLGQSEEQSALLIEEAMTSKSSKVDVAEDAEKYDLAKDEVENYAKSLLELSKISSKVDKALDKNIEAAEDIAVAHARLNKGFEDLIDNFGEYRTAIEGNDESSLEYQNAINSLQTSMADLFNLTDGKLLSASFLEDEKNLNLLQEAINGNVQSLDELQRKASSEIFKQAVQNVDGDATQARAQTQLSAYLETLQKEIDAADLKIGADFNTEDSFNSLNALLRGSAITVEEIQSYFNTLGFVPQMTPVTTEAYVEDENGIPKKTSITVPKITGLNYKGPNEKIISDSNKTKAKKNIAKKSDVVDRYKETEDKLKRIRNIMSDLEKISDRVFGAARINALKEINKQLEQEKKTLEDQRIEAIKYKAEDKQAVIDEANKLGATFEFDSDGNISNYTTEMEKLYSKYKNDADKLDDLKDAIAQYEETKDKLLDINDAIDEKFYEWQDNNYEQLTYRLEFHLEIDDMQLREVEYQLEKLKDNPEKAVEALGLLAGKATNIAGRDTELGTMLSGLGLSGSGNEMLFTMPTDENGNALYSDQQYLEGLQLAYDKIFDQREMINELDEAMMSYYGDTYDKLMDQIQKYTSQMDNLNGVLDHYSNIVKLLGHEKDYTLTNTILQGKQTVAENQMIASSNIYDQTKAQREAAEETLANATNDKAKEVAEQNLQIAIEKEQEAYNQFLSDAESYAQAVHDVWTAKIEQAAEEMEKTLTDGVGFDELEKRLSHSKTLQDEYLTDTNKIYETDKMLRDIQQKSDKTTNSLAKQRLKDFSDEIKAMQSKGELSKLELEIAQKRFSVLEAQIALEEAQNAKSTVRLQRDSEGNFGYVYTADSEKVAEAEQNLADAENDLYNTRLDAANEYAEKTLQVQKDLVAELTEIEKAYQNGAYESEEEYRRARAEAIARADELLLTYQEQYNIATLENYEEINDDIKKTKEELAKNNKEFLDAEQFKEDEWLGGRKTAYDGYYEALGIFQGDYVKTTQENTPLIQDAWTGTHTIMDNSAKNWQTALTGEDGKSGYIGAVNNAFNDAKTNLDKVAEEMGADLNSTSGLAEILVTKVGNITTKSGELADKIEDEVLDAFGDNDSGLMRALNKTNDFYNDQWDALDDLEDKYDKYVKAIQAAITKLQELQRQQSIETPSGNTGESNPLSSPPPNDPPPKQPTYKYVEYDNYDEEADLGMGESTRYQYEEGGDGADKDDNSSSGLLAIGDKVKVADNDNLDYLPAYHKNLKGNLFWNSYTNRDKISGKTITNAKFYDGQMYYELSDTQDLFGYTSWYKSEHLQKYNTGGYTGEWGPEGKLAMLHQKELVLNADDTSNILQTVAFMRELVSMLDKQASMASLFNLSAVGGITSHNNALDQIVTIHAEFPNATDHNEIEEAFKNLINTASQYANRK